MKNPVKILAILAIAAFVGVGCSGGSGPDAGGGTSSPVAGNSDASLKKDDYPVFPNADAGADPAVPAEQGGKGFAGDGWETNTGFDLLGDPRAVKGGLYRESITSFPATLRYVGLNGSTVTNFVTNSLIYETLLELNPTTLEPMPALATHWQIQPDKMTFRFRIDPNAKFSDGQPVTAEDVVASWKLFTDKSIQDPLKNTIYNEFEQPVAESKYLVRVKSKEPKWLNFIQFSQSLLIFPAHVLKGMDGAAFIKDWNFKMLPGTGPYMIRETDVQKGQSLSVRRRPDYWAAKSRRMVGRGNFDEIKLMVVRDDNLEYEMIKRGDVDNYVVLRAQRWIEELNFEDIQRGLLQKRKIFNHQPQSIGGIAFNTRRAPFNDIRVRTAIAHLFNRELLLEKMMFSQYDPMDSHFPGSIYENPKNEKMKYNPQKAIELLKEAGWSNRDSSGRLAKGGQPLTLELLHYAPTYNRFFTVFQEDLRKVGITLNLREVTPETAFQLKDDQNFDLICMFYGGGSPFPLPKQFYHSSQDVKAGDNLTGFRMPRADAIVEEYDREFDLQKRIALLRELDGLVTAERHWILFWTASYNRYLFWNKFGYPDWYTSRIGERDRYDPLFYWWIDPEKERRLEEARRDPSIKLEVGPTDITYWKDFAKREEQAAPAR
jgi:microcin C transport system substrate-binding protein